MEGKFNMNIKKCASIYWQLYPKSQVCTYLMNIWNLQVKLIKKHIQKTISPKRLSVDNYLSQT